MSAVQTAVVFREKFRTSLWDPIGPSELVPTVEAIKVEALPQKSVSAIFAASAVADTTVAASLYGQHDANDSSDDIENIHVLSDNDSEVEGATAVVTATADVDVEAKLKTLLGKRRRMTKDFSSLYKLIEKLSEIKTKKSTDEANQIVREVHGNLRQRRERENDRFGGEVDE